jgi:hypothetical protein
MLSVGAIFLSLVDAAVRGAARRAEVYKNLLYSWIWEKVTNPSKLP